MSSSDRTDRQNPRKRRFESRRKQIIAAALNIAEADGWPAVTTRRLAEAIDYSQPVVYQHFTSRDDIISEIAIEGFAALADDIESVAASQPARPLEAICRSYIEFGTRNPRLYEAMFSVPTSIAFDSSETPTEARRAFAVLRKIISQQVSNEDPDAASEFFWASCHGLVSLVTTGRIPRDRLQQHIAWLARTPPFG